MPQSTCACRVPVEFARPVLGRHTRSGSLGVECLPQQGTYVQGLPSPIMPRVAQFRAPHLWWAALTTLPAIPSAALLPLEAGPTLGSRAAETAALVGDAWLKAAVLLELGAGEGDARPGQLTQLTAAAVSNALLSLLAPRLLCGTEQASGVSGEAFPLRNEDLLCLHEHGRATAVEAAVFAVQSRGNASAVRDLAKTLLEHAEGHRNYTGMLLENGGTFVSTIEIVEPESGVPLFVATARLGTNSASSSPATSIQRAKAEAAELVLRELRLLDPVEETVLPVVVLDTYRTGCGFNLKAALIERGGRILDAEAVSGASLGGLFCATASLGTLSRASPPLPRKTLAETAAASAVLVAAGLLSPEDAARAATSEPDPQAAPFTRADISRLTSNGVVNFKGLLLERSGSVSVECLPGQKFVATACWRDTARESSGSQVNKKSAEAIACRLVLISAGLLDIQLLSL